MLKAEVMYSFSVFIDLISEVRNPIVNVRFPASRDAGFMRQ